MFAFFKALKDPFQWTNGCQNSFEQLKVNINKNMFDKFTSKPINQKHLNINQFFGEKQENTFDYKSKYLIKLLL